MIGIVIVFFLMLLGLLLTPIIMAVKYGDRIRSLEKKVAELEKVKIAEVSGDITQETMSGTAEAMASVAEAQPEPADAEVGEKATGDTAQSRMSASKVQTKPVKVERSKVKKETPEWLKKLFTVESLISKLGILLLLIGVGFIYKLAYDSGYVTEEMAVFLGAVIGGVLIYLGYRVAARGRKILSQVLFGGGVAALYITVYAAYQGYGLIHGILAFLFMCAVTAGGFVLALLTDSIAMSVIAVSGGLLTPFVLQLEQLGLFGTGSYVFIIALLSMGIYVVKRWRILQVTAIVEVLLVTGYFISIEGMSDPEKVQLSLLLVLLMLVFTGVEHWLAFTDRSSSRFPSITYTIMAALPLITAGQVWMVLEMTDRGWAMFFAGAAVVYLLVATVYNRMQKDLILENITIGLTGTFFLLAIAVAYGGDVRVMAIAALALIYYLLSKRLDSSVVRWMGHILGGLAWLMAMVVLLEIDRPELMSAGAYGLRLVTALMFAGMAYLNLGKERLVIGVLALEWYLLPLMYVFNEGLLMHQDPPVEAAVQLLFVIAFIWGLFLLNRWRTVVPEAALAILAVLPFVHQLQSAVDAVDDRSVELLMTAAYLIGAALLYALVQTVAKSISRRYRLPVKIAAYGMLYLILLVDFGIVADGFVFGLIGAGGLIFLQRFIEPDREEAWMVFFGHCVSVGWFLLTVGYALSTFDRDHFDWVIMVADMGLVIILYLHMKYYEWRLNAMVRFGILGIVFMLMTFTNMDNLKAGNGITTLLWAAYAIGLLAYSVRKADSRLVNMSLGFIIVVAAKFVIIDLASVTTIWKIIVSMAFGSALLVLSYLLQPILKRE